MLPLEVTERHHGLIKWLPSPSQTASQKNRSGIWHITAQIIIFVWLSEVSFIHNVNIGLKNLKKSSYLTLAELNTAKTCNQFELTICKVAHIYDLIQPRIFT